MRSLAERVGDERHSPEMRNSFSMKKPLPYVTDTAWLTRVRILRIIFSLVFFVLLYRLFYWQVLQSDRLRAEAASQYSLVSKTVGSRGRIFSADGYLLAANQDVYTMFAEPKKLTQPSSQIASLLAPLMPTQNLDASDAASLADANTSAKNLVDEWKTTFEKRLENGSRWVALKRKLSKDAKLSIENLHLDGIGFEQDEMRSYPEASMAAQVLGFVGNDENGDPHGYFGIEGAYDRELRARSGVVKQQKDALGLPIAVGSYDAIGSQDGRDVTLTIKRDLQFMLEEKLKGGMEKYGSKTAEAAIMNPKTGEILAMASFPSYDPARFYTFSPETYKNLFVQDSYEPGSTLKILTVSAGIDAGAVTPDTQCDTCFGPRVISGYTIKTWNDTYFPNTTITEGLVHSDNTAMIFTAQRLGKDKFVEYLQKFGLGQKTGLDVLEEALPPFRKDWRELDVATASFGQGIAVTGIQMLSIAQTIANHGMTMKPMLVRSVTQNGQTITVEPKQVGKPISEDTANQVTNMMIGATEYGDAKWALPKGYSIAGKTGTAQVPVAGHYDQEKTVASFVGFAPANDPKFVMLVKLREPQSSPWGSETAAPLWFSIAKDVFVRLNISPNGI